MHLPEISSFTSFMVQARSDGRIGPLHISLYMAIWYYHAAEDFRDPVKVSARELMPLAKIGSRTLYHRCIRELHEYGYIRYRPSCDPCDPSEVRFWW